MTKSIHEDVQIQPERNKWPHVGGIVMVHGATVYGYEGGGAKVVTNRGAAATHVGRWYYNERGERVR